MKKLVLYGAGGFGRETAAIIEDINKNKQTYELVGFLDDGTKFKKGDLINGYPFLGGKEWILEHKDEVYCTCTIGNAKIKAEIQRHLTKQGVIFETIIADSCRICNYSEIGQGCVFYRNVGVSVNCKIGDGVLINSGCSIGHDTVIGNYTTIMSSTGISGGCIIGDEVSIGGHAFIIPGKKIGKYATVAAGSIVFTNVREGTVVLGNPAKRMKELE